MIRRIAVAISLMLWIAGVARIADAQILHPGTSRASDALPLYLSGASVQAGMDPTLKESLAQVYDQRHLQVGAATFSTLYPATAGWLLQPYASLDWDGFSAAWRWTLLLAIASFPFLFWRMGGGSWSFVIGALIAWHPVTQECVRLGQVNMVLAVGCALAMGTSEWAGGLGLAIGSLLKLVPGALAIPLLLTRRWRPLLVMGVVGLAGLWATTGTVPLLRILEAIRETLRFQGSIDPDWLVGRTLAPSWMRWLGFVRHTPLQWITLIFVTLIPALRPSKATCTGAMALLCAWLGADAAGFHVLYIPLAYPAFLWVSVGRPLQMGVIGGIWFMLAWVEPSDVGPEPRMVLFGLLLWCWSLGRLLRDASQVKAHQWEEDWEWKQGMVTLLGVMVGSLLAHAWPTEGPVAAPLPEGQQMPEGPGFIHPQDRVPGQVRALGGGLDRPASTLAKPGTIRALQVYLLKAPVLWRGLAERYPARSSLFLARASEAPSGELRDLSGREVQAWLQAEERAVNALKAEGLDAGELPVYLEAALASGLAASDLEAHLPDASH